VTRADSQTGRSSIEPELTAPEGFEALDRHAGERASTFLSGDPDGNRLKVRYFWNEAERGFLTRVWFGLGSEGPPGRVHGGAVAAVMDESMGSASWCFGHPAVAAKIEVEFRTTVPLGTLATVEISIDEVVGRKLKLRGRLIGDDGTEYSRCHGLFIEQDPKSFGRYADWARLMKERRLRSEGTREGEES
jgi:hypothetical protein